MRSRGPSPMLPTTESSISRGALLGLRPGSEERVGIEPGPGAEGHRPSPAFAAQPIYSCTLTSTGETFFVQGGKFAHQFERSGQGTCERVR